jgi:hypothetical protein
MLFFVARASGGGVTRAACSFALSARAAIVMLSCVVVVSAE